MKLEWCVFETMEGTYNWEVFKEHGRLFAYDTKYRSEDLAKKAVMHWLACLNGIEYEEMVTA